MCIAGLASAYTLTRKDRISMIIYSIYRVVNKVNGKVYIGFDSNWPKRKQSHYYNHRAKSCPKWSFYNALKKYGWENFQWDVIYQSKEKHHTLKEMESFFIEQYDSFRNGYNQTNGGEGTFGKLQSIENKRKQSQRRKSMNEKSRWYNNGKVNKFSSEHPGIDWILGRINQKPSTKGYKWYNNGIEQRLTNKQPEGWIPGML